MHHHGIDCHAAVMVRQQIIANPILSEVHCHSGEWRKRGRENGGVVAPVSRLTGIR